MLKVKNLAKEIHNNPAKFAGSAAEDFFLGLFVLPIIFSVAIVGSLYALGFTGLLGGPYGFFKFLFFLSLILLCLFFYLLRKVYKFVGKTTESVADKTLKVDNKIIE